MMHEIVDEDRRARYLEELAERMPVVQLLHEGCEECAALVETARTHAAVTGSNGATYRNNTPAGVHEAKVGPAAAEPETPAARACLVELEHDAHEWRELTPATGLEAHWCAGVGEAVGGAS